MSDKFPIAISAVTDNRSNQQLSRKQSTTKWPLMLINMQLSHHLLKAFLKLDLRWRPREENTLADDLTNSRFESFDLERRIQCEYTQLPLELLNKLWATKSQFDFSRRSLQDSDTSGLPAKRKHDKSSW